MELKVNIGYEELLALVKQLPSDKIASLKSEINQKPIIRKTKGKLSDFQKFLLTAPVMTAEQFSQFTENRKNFSQWRSK